MNSITVTSAMNAAKPSPALISRFSRGEMKAKGKKMDKPQNRSGQCGEEEKF
jgi:hypothetical protein